MRKLLLGTFSLILACMFSTSVNASSESNTVITGDTNENIVDIADVEIEVDKGSTFTVGVPVLREIKSTDWFAYKYNKYYMNSIVNVKGDLASDEQIVIAVDEILTMIPEGGLKESVNWVTFTKPNIWSSAILNSENLSTTNAQNYGISEDIYIKPNKDTTAGIWHGVVHVNVTIEDYGYILTEKQFKEYVCSDTSVTSLTIPKYINIDGKQVLVGGIKDDTLKDFTNIEDIFLETDKEFRFEDAFGKCNFNTKILTIHANNIPVYQGGYEFLDTSIRYEGCQLLVAQNPYCGTYGSPESIPSNYYHYDDIDTLDLENAIAIYDALGQFTELRLNPEIKYMYSGCLNDVIAEKLIIPEFKYLCYDNFGIFRGVDAKVVEIDNYYIGSNWFEDAVNIEKVVLSNNVEYIGKEAFANCTSLVDIVIPESVKYIDPTAFSNTPFLKNLKKDVENVYINGIWICYGDLYVQGEHYIQPAVSSLLSSSDLNDTVRKISFENSNEVCNLSGTFNNVTSVDFTGRNVSFGGSLSNFFPNATSVKFGGKDERVYSLQNNSKITNIELVEGLGTIGNYDFNHATGYVGTSLYIPSTVYHIGSLSPQWENTPGNGWSTHVFYDFGKDSTYDTEGSLVTQGFCEFIVNEDSPYYTVEDGILYTKDKSALIAIPRAKEFENGIYVMPNEVKLLGELTFSRNKNITEIVIGDNLEIYNSKAELAKAYGYPISDGTYSLTCLNEGNSLSIATYQFTNIEKYTVKDTNPNYTSVNGVIYTKDLKELVAIPNHYQGEIIIPEGCVKWRENAMWIDSGTGFGVNMGITSITIPSTMTDIDERQLEYLNNTLYVNKIQIAEGNPVYTRFTEWAGIPRAVHKAQTINNLKYTGTTGSYWFSAWGSNIYTIGADINDKTATFLPIYLPEGMYELKSDYNDESDNMVRYKAIIGLSSGKTESVDANEVMVNYTTEKSILNIGKGGRFVFISASIVDSTGVDIYDAMTQEIGDIILDSLKITRINDNLILKGSRWDMSGSIAADDAKARTKYVTEFDNSKTYKITLNTEDDNFWFGVFAFKDGTAILDSGWKTNDTTVTITSADSYVLNFAYGNRAQIITDEMLKTIAKGITIEELENHTHNYTSVITEADCIYDGSITHTCDCGYTYIETLNKTGHSYEEGVCILCGGYENFINAGVYNEYGIMTNTWQELVENSLITVWYDNTIKWVSPELTGVIVIDDSITVIGDSAFSGCNKLTNIILPESLTTIENNAFYECNKIESIIIPNSVTSLGAGAFYNCSSLKSIRLSNNLENINTYTFAVCTSLEEIIVPENVKSIGQQAFTDCTKLKRIDLPEGLESIGNQAFWSCNHLEEINIPSTVTLIGREAFCFCSSIKTLTIPASITTFEYREFCQMDNLETVYFKHEEIPVFGEQLFSKWGGVKTTFYFKNSDVANSFTTSCYESEYGTISEDYDW